MKIELTCPECGKAGTYNDREWVPYYEFLASDEEETYNFAVCKECGYNIEFVIEVKDIK